MLNFSYTQKDVNRWVIKSAFYSFGFLSIMWALIGINYAYDSYHEARAAINPMAVQQTKSISTRELAEHFNACVQAYTRTAHPIPMEVAEQRCNCAGDYLSVHGYGDISFRDAQKVCGNG